MENETERGLDAIISALSSKNRINDWVVQSDTGESTQLFLIGAEPEAVRQVSNVRYRVTVYCDHERGRGQATVSLTPADMQAIDELLDRAAFMASLSGNPPYSLPGPAALPEVALLDESIATRSEAEAAARRLRADVIDSMAAESHVRLSSLEAFLDTSAVRLHTSAGVQGSYRGTRVTLDLAIISRGDDGKESEAHETWVRRRLADLDLPTLVKEQARYARDALEASLPPSGRYPVVLLAEEAQALLAPILFRASGEAKYSGQTSWEAGQPVLIDGDSSGGEHDPVTLLSDATFPFGTPSRPFDDEGLPGQRVAILKDGVLNRFLANRRYAEYLKIPPTGPTGMLVLNAGTKAAPQIMDPGEGNLLHVVSFSAMAPDHLTGDFSAEIRLGYLVSRNGTRSVRGGTVSGNVFSAFGGATFSRDEVFLGGYQGPRLLRFSNLSVTGEEAM